MKNYASAYTVMDVNQKVGRAKRFNVGRFSDTT